MKKLIKKIYYIFLSIFMIGDIVKFKNHNDGRFKIRLQYLFPQLKDKTEKTGFDAHYIYHPAWAARILSATKPKKHIDISSTLHFAAIMSAFIKIEFYDYRPVDIPLSNLICGKTDLTNLQFPSESIFSLSCMHTIEHIGLGRYGETIDPVGDLKAISELKRVLAKGGSLLFVVPVGRPKIMYNAHRIYSFEMIKDYFQGLRLQEFSLIDDQGNFLEKADPILVKDQKYGCGCFWFIKE